MPPKKVASKTVDIVNPTQTGLFSDPSIFNEQPDYTNEEAEYRNKLLLRLENDYNKRESPHIEYNGMTYTQNYKANALAANSYTPPRKNPEDTMVVTGTTREKVLAIVSAILNLNFETNFIPFDKDDTSDEELGEGMSDCVERSNKIEMWDEKKLYAYFEMAVQGDVYLEELFIEQVQTDKKKIPLSQVDEELMKSFKAENKVKMTTAICERNLIPGTQVLKGNMREPDLRKQPHISTVDYKPYEWAKAVYGNLPRFKNVPRTLITNSPTQSSSGAFGINWRLDVNSCDNDFCEIIKYQDKWNDEYQIIINGILMLPVGFPMPWEYGEYNIVQGKLEPISAFFSESKSIPTKTKLDQEILDEMYRLAVLKTQKSFMPPIANYSANLLDRSMFWPSKVNNNLSKGDIEVLGGDPSMYSLKPSEFEMIQMVKRFIDEKSINPLLQGQQLSGEQTATEVNTVMQEARRQLGVMIFGFMQFHLNLDTLRLYNILENYTKPIGNKLDETKQGIEQKYRSLTLSKNLGSKGYGVKKIQFTKKKNTPAELFDMENGITRNDQGTPLAINPPKKPLRIIQIDPEAIRAIKYTWYGEVVPVEKDTSQADRIAFEDRLQFAMSLWGPQDINKEYAQEHWASKNKLDFNEFFKRGVPMPMAEGGTETGMTPQTMPQESNMKKQMRPFSSGAGPAEALRQGIG